MRKPMLMLAITLLSATAVPAQQQTADDTTTAPPAAAAGSEAPAAVKPPAKDHDAVVAAAQRSAEMHAQAAKAAQEAVDKATHGGPLAQAQRHLLMAAALLYNSSAQLTRVAQKEAMRAQQRQALGEQKESAAAALGDDEDKTEARRQGKAYLAYGTAQATIAEAMADFATRQEELAKEADDAGKVATSEPLETSAKNIIAQTEAAKKLAADVRQTRAMLEKMLP